MYFYMPRGHTSDHVRKIKLFFSVFAKGIKTITKSKKVDSILHMLSCYRIAYSELYFLVPY